MGSRAWRSLSVLVVASAALVGCNNPQKETRILKEGPLPPFGQAKTQQKPPAFPGGQQQFNPNAGKQGVANQQKPAAFTPTSNQNPGGFVPNDPFKTPFPQHNQGGALPKSGINPPANNGVPTPPNFDLPPSPTTFGSQREGVQLTTPPNGFSGAGTNIAPPPSFPMK